jgi:hypothetical protein
MIFSSQVRRYGTQIGNPKISYAKLIGRVKVAVFMDIELLAPAGREGKHLLSIVNKVIEHHLRVCKPP